MVPNLRATWSEWQSERVHDTDGEPPPRLDRFGLIRAGESRSALIVVVGVLVGVLALAAVLGYVVFHALTSTERTTVGVGEATTSGTVLTRSIEVADQCFVGVFVR
jgi:hypothetical protein